MKPLLQLATAAVVFTTNVALALPIDLGRAGQFTLLSSGTPAHHGQPLYGNLELGSEAYIHGNVGSRNTLNMAHGSEIYQNADFGSLFQNPGALIKGDSRQQDAHFWDKIYSDLKSASLQAKSLSGVHAGFINNSQTLTSQGSLSVYNITGLNLSAGHSLTLKGNSDDAFIINVDHFGFMLGGGASIVLDGIKAKNVLFNVHGALNNGHVNVASGSIQGTFIAPDGYMQLGDGLQLDQVRFLGAGISGNLQEVHGIEPPTASVPEPATLLLLLTGALGLIVARRTNSARKRE